MELCDHSLSIRKCPEAFTEAQVLDALFQVNFLRDHFSMGLAVLCFITRHVGVMKAGCLTRTTFYLL